MEPGYCSLQGHVEVRPAAVVTVFDPGGVDDAADAVHLPRLAPYLRLVPLAQTGEQLRQAGQYSLFRNRQIEDSLRDLVLAAVPLLPHPTNAPG